MYHFSFSYNLQVDACTYSLSVMKFIFGFPRLKILRSGLAQQNFELCVPVQLINTVLYLMILAFNPCLTSLWKALFVLYQKVNQVSTIILFHGDLSNYYIYVFIDRRD